jgi:hypothetical protein
MCNIYTINIYLSGYVVIATTKQKHRIAIIERLLFLYYNKIVHMVVQGDPKKTEPLKMLINPT